MRRQATLIVFTLLPALPAAALDLPARRAGLWELQMSRSGGNIPAMTSQHCIDAKTDQQMNALGGAMGQEVCSKQDVQRSGGTITVDSVCKIGPTSMTSHAVITGDFNSAYTIRVTSRRDGGTEKQKSAPGNTTMTIEAKYLGACKPDQRPGDIIMAGGRRFNILDLQKLQKGLGQQIPGAPAPRP